MGRVDGHPFRTEVTLLDHTGVIPWAGMQVEVAVSQYVAFLGGRIHEVAYDLYAQDDAGNVWYFGEDVYNSPRRQHRRARMAPGSAGIDGPRGDDHAGRPAAGDVSGPRTFPASSYEEVTVKRTGQPFRGPLARRLRRAGDLRAAHGRKPGGERKTFAPGYGRVLHLWGWRRHRGAGALGAHRRCPMEQCPLRCWKLGAEPSDHGVRRGDARRNGRDRPGREIRAGVAWRSLSRGDVPRLLRPLLERSVLRARRGGGSRGRCDQAAIGLTRLTQETCGCATGRRTPSTCSASRHLGSPRCARRAAAP